MIHLFAEMETLRVNRLKILRDLDRNTIAMRFLVIEGKANGVGVYQIATALGVSNRTAYLWLKT